MLVKLNGQVKHSSVGYYHKVTQQIAKQVVQEYVACTKDNVIGSLQFFLPVCQAQAVRMLCTDKAS
jgi:hypothetical protein